MKSLRKRLKVPLGIFNTSESMEIEIVNYTKFRLPSQKRIRNSIQFFEQALTEKKILNSQSTNKKLVIAFISSLEIKKLNKRYLKKNRPTDILSFSPIEDNSFGELVLCAEKIKEQAKELKSSFEEETSYLLLHGLLHLLGYHHEKGGAEAKKMYQIQDEIFSLFLVSK